jgi:hypothetical protein
MSVNFFQKVSGSEMRLYNLEREEERLKIYRKVEDLRRRTSNGSILAHNKRSGKMGRASGKHLATASKGRVQRHQQGTSPELGG